MQLSIDDLSESIRLDPQYADAYRLRGIVYGLLGQTEPPTRDLNETIVLNPEDSNAYVWRGSVYADLGQTDQALKDFDEAILLSPQDADTYVLRAKAQTVLGNYTAAQHDLDLAAVHGADPVDIERREQELRRLAALRTQGLFQEFRLLYKGAVASKRGRSDFKAVLLLNADKYGATYLAESCLLGHQPTVARYREFLDQTLQMVTQDGVPAITVRVNTVISDIAAMFESPMTEAFRRFTLDECIVPFVYPASGGEIEVATAIVQPLFSYVSGLFRETVVKGWDRRVARAYYDWTDPAIERTEPFLLWF